MRSGHVAGGTYERVVTIARLLGVAAVIGRVGVVAIRGAAIEQGPDAAPSARVMPRYDKDRNLQLPANYRQWVLAGSSLGLSYAEGGGQGMQMFNTTLIEPTAYALRRYRRVPRRNDAGVDTARTSAPMPFPLGAVEFATDVHGVEMAVEGSSSRVPEGWAYYNFGGSMMGGLEASAAPQPKNNCFSCHVEHAKARQRVHAVLRVAERRPPERTEMTWRIDYGGSEDPPQRRPAEFCNRGSSAR